MYLSLSIHICCFLCWSSSILVSGDRALTQASNEAVSHHHLHHSDLISLSRIRQGVHAQTLVLCSPHPIEGYLLPSMLRF